MPLKTLPSIPRIMRTKKGWSKAATLLDTWFSWPKSAYPNYLAPDTTTITMAWALGFERASETYNDLVKQRIWLFEPAQKKIAELLKRKSLLTNAPMSFGQLHLPVLQQDADYINQRSVGTGTHLDEMTAALGNFNFRVVVAGTVAPYKGGRSTHRVEITEVGVYIRDSFDFEGTQPLGYWSDTPIDDFAAGPAKPYLTAIWNNDFREWRNKNNLGGDFLIYSDIKRIREAKPFSFHF